MWGFAAVKLQILVAPESFILLLYRRWKDGMFRFLQRGSLRIQKIISPFSETDCDRNWEPKCTVSPKAAWDKVDLQVIVHLQTRQTCSGKNSVQDSDCLRELLVDNRSRDCVSKCVSYLHTLVLFMYFYNFTVKICLYVFFISNIFWYKVERYETFVLTFYIE